MPKGERRVMDCMDCHNRAAHTFMTAEDALTAPWPKGVSPDLPWVHKEGLQLLKADYKRGRGKRKDSRAARGLLPQPASRGAAAKAELVKAAGEQLATLYNQNVFPA